MNKNIDIFIYSYQNKFLFDNIKKNINNSSKKNNLFFYIIDQNNINRSQYIDIEEPNVKIFYNYVKWDSLKSPILYKKEHIEKTNKDYYMQCGDGVILKNNWDADLINFLNNKNAIISGNHTYDIINENLFFIKKYKKNSIDFNKVSIIDRDLIFADNKIISKIEYPKDLKYYGEEEYISINLNKNNIDIYSMPTNYMENNTEKMEDVEYVPFSLTHKYNDFIRNNKHEINEIYNIKLIELLFNNDDVIYDVKKSQTDKTGGNRYLNKIKEIN